MWNLINCGSSQITLPEYDTVDGSEIRLTTWCLFTKPYEHGMFSTSTGAGLPGPKAARIKLVLEAQHEGGKRRRRRRMKTRTIK